MTYSKIDLLKEAAYLIKLLGIQKHEHQRLLSIGFIRDKDDYYLINWIPSSAHDHYEIDNVNELIKYRLTSPIFISTEVSKT